MPRAVLGVFHMCNYSRVQRCHSFASRKQGAVGLMYGQLWGHLGHADMQRQLINKHECRGFAYLFTSGCRLQPWSGSLANMDCRDAIRQPA